MVARCAQHCGDGRASLQVEPVLPRPSGHRPATVASTLAAGRRAICLWLTPV